MNGEVAIRTGSPSATDPGLVVRPVGGSGGTLTDAGIVLDAVPAPGVGQQTLTQNAYVSGPVQTTSPLATSLFVNARFGGTGMTSCKVKVQAKYDGAAPIGVTFAESDVASYGNKDNLLTIEHTYAANSDDVIDLSGLTCVGAWEVSVEALGGAPAGADRVCIGAMVRV